MKRLYYCEGNIETPTLLSQRDDSENERRKQLSIETNRRRREMAMKVKKEIEKEERRRNEILKQRREYQNGLNEKLHRRSAQRRDRTTSVQPHTVSDLDRTLTALRGTITSSSLKQRAQSSEDIAKYNNRLESAWSDNREMSPSPMLKYSGREGSNRHRGNDHYLKTFETKLMEQEEVFRQKQTVEIDQFSRILDETVLYDTNNESIKPNYDEGATYRTSREFIDVVDCDLEDSLDNKDGTDDINSSKCEEKIYLPKDLKPLVLESLAPNLISPPSEKPVNSFIYRGPSPQYSSTNSIKSILKKGGGISDKFGSNPDITDSGHKPMDIRDSVEVTKTRSSRLFRSSSFSQGLDSNQTEEDSNRKFVRFAEDSSNHTNIVPVTKPVTIGNSELKPQMQKPPSLPVPGSTPLKPPLHPRSAQEGSYSRKTAPSCYQPPPRPAKISAETLDKQLEPILHPRRAPPQQQQQMQQQQQQSIIGTEDSQIFGEFISLEKTPTETEIEQLWAEVRECLSRGKDTGSNGDGGRLTSRPESVGLGVSSVRTFDSGSDAASVRSAPAPFQVRHHQRQQQHRLPVRQGGYQGQELPVRDEVTVHGGYGDHHCGDHNHATVTQHPLSVLGQRDRGFQAVSESLEEFLTIEGSCAAPQSRRLTSVPTASVFLPRPPSNLRARTQPMRWHTNNNHNNLNNVPKTQMSLDEDKVKQSLDRLNDRLKNMTTFV